MKKQKVCKSLGVGNGYKLYEAPPNEFGIKIISVTDGPPPTVADVNACLNAPLALRR